MELNNTVLGIELGSTRIKAVLIDRDHNPIASGDHEWENQLVDGVWTYSMVAIHTGLQDCFAKLKRDVQEKYGVTLTTTGAIGVSAMMHGYLPFDKDMVQLAAFRTWRNTITGPAAAALTRKVRAEPSESRTASPLTAVFSPFASTAGYTREEGSGVAPVRATVWAAASSASFT